MEHKGPPRDPSQRKRRKTSWKLRMAARVVRHPRLTYDLIVGAWSRARSAIPSAAPPIYSSVCFGTSEILRLRGKDPKVDAMIGGGTYAARGDGKAIVSQRGVNGSAHIYLFFYSKCAAETEKELQSSTHDEECVEQVSPSTLIVCFPLSPKITKIYQLPPHEL